MPARSLGRIATNPLRPRPSLPFWVHQGAEYALALFLADLALHGRGRAAVALATGAGGLAGLAALSDGPLGGIRLLPRRAHRALDVVVVAAVAVSPLVVRHSVAWVVTTELMALVLLRLLLTTSYDKPLRRSNGATTRVVKTTARQTGRLVGRAARHVPEDGVTAERALITGARGLGHLTNKVRGRRRPRPPSG